jgi:hypothetical protein
MNAGGVVEVVAPMMAVPMIELIQLQFRERKYEL